MEYEIESEAGLFDASTNPSLERGRAPGRAAEKRQKAEVIPDEEEQMA